MSNTYQPSNLGGVATTGYMQPARPVTPTPPAPATSTTYAPSFPVTPLDYTSHVESGNRNIPQQIHDVNTAKGTPAKGYWQIIDPTWRTYAQKAGVDLNQYPTAMSAPRDVQARVASLIPGTQFGPNTQAALRAKFPGIDLSKPLGTYGGTAGGAGNPAPAAQPSAPSAQPADNLLALAALSSSPGGGQKSTMDNLSSMFPQAPPDQGGGMQNNLQAQQAAAAGNIRQQQIAQRAAQLSAGLQQYAAQPLSWGTQPLGANAGPRAPLMSLAGQQPPGTTLNSMGGQ